MEQKKLVLKEETKKRCFVTSYQDKKSQFTEINLEHFNYLFNASHINFSLWFRVSDELVEFIKPTEFSKELLRQVVTALKKGYDNLAIMIRQDELVRFNQLIRDITSAKIERVAENYPGIDRQAVVLYSDLSSASQLIIKGGITENVANQCASVSMKTATQLKSSAECLAALEAMCMCDPTLYDHSASVAMLSAFIAKSCCVHHKLANQDIAKIIKSALYHDLGKTCIPGTVLNKPGAFTPEERNLMKSHTTFGYNELMKLVRLRLPIEEEVALVALEHHEHFCGGGYPLNKKGRCEDYKTEEEKKHAIHLYSRIVSIADVYSALLMKRCYKNEMPKDSVWEIMRSEKDHYDPVIFDAFDDIVNRASTVDLSKKEIQPQLDKYKKYD